MTKHYNINQEHKLFENIKNSTNNAFDNSSQEIEIIITTCLTEDHRVCTEKYSDSTRKFIIKCLCQCHKELSIHVTKKEYNND